LALGHDAHLLGGRPAAILDEPAGLDTDRREQSLKRTAAASAPTMPTSETGRERDDVVRDVRRAAQPDRTPIRIARFGTGASGARSASRGRR